LFDDSYKGKKVFITGHTGFKGSWLSLWLTQLGAHVMGYSLPPPTLPNHFEQLNLDMVSIQGDIRDKEGLERTLGKYRPDILFHLAAQPLVRKSYAEPVDTFATNTMGTLNVLEISRHVDEIRAIIVVTSDKCYENREWVWGYRETDPMGGHDPYSASKACAELIAACWRKSYFDLEGYGTKHQTLLTTVRAGNVIGGGDWAPDRLVPDIVRAASTNDPVLVRNPNAIRPWQHVLDPLSGYLLLGQKLLEGRTGFSGPWNFGPGDLEKATVAELIDSAKTVWPRIRYRIKGLTDSLHEDEHLSLDCSKARSRLGWKPVWSLATSVARTIGWYRHFYEDGCIDTAYDMDYFVEEARTKHIGWALG
jgi:CDP-glucose 4,6-dehydratase